MERSTNRNRLIYEVNIEKADPIHPYWKMLEEDGHEEALTSFEREHLYGVTINSRSATELNFQFRALSSLSLHVKEDGRTYVPILGEDRRLDRIFLRMGGGLFPSLSSVEFDVSDETDQKHAYELNPRDGAWKDLGAR
jgi:hypothetical protein